jgi:heme-degrading monooxygenase HmoA
MPGFAWYAVRSNMQARRAAGMLGMDLLADREWTFWTMTAWESRAAMLAFMTNGPHKRAMPKLLDWCDEASVAHWEQEDAKLVGWDEADRRMRATGRASKVRWPSAAHAGLRYREPRGVRRE